VEPLTSQRIKDKFELRTILETAALRSAKFDTAALRALVADINALDRSAVLTPATWFALEERFFRYAILSTPNQDLAESAQANRRALAACQSALFSLGLPPDSQSLAELGTVIDLALSGTVTAATSMLATHLTRARDRTIAQLKITAIIDPPSDLPRYLQRA
jgi:DNA-binding GntR family transcriptional regulator